MLIEEVLELLDMLELLLEALLDVLLAVETDGLDPVDGELVGLVRLDVSEEELKELKELELELALAL